MKVISGYLKGRKLSFLKDKRKLRPTKDMTREAIFDVLRGWIEGKRVLDLFAGTGALGIEALSNGALEVLFVESDREAVNVIKKNIAALNIEDACSVKRGEAEKVVEGFDREEFDLIIADPPYGYPKKKIEGLLKSIIEGRRISEEGIIVIEHGRKDGVPEVAGLEAYKEKSYGRSSVSYLRAHSDEK